MIALSILSLLACGAFATQTVHIQPQSLNYTGTWQAGTSSGCGANYKTYTLGSTVSYTFTGVGWSLYLGSGGASAADQATDGINTWPVTNFSTPTQNCTSGFSASNLPYGEHTVTATHESSDGSGTYVMGFEYVSLDAAEIASLSSASSLGSATSSVGFVSPANPTQPVQVAASGSHGISTGAILGIVIGVVVIVLAVLLFFYLKHRTRANGESAEAARQMDMTSGGLHDRHPAALQVEYMPVPYPTTAYTPTEAGTTGVSSPLSDTKSSPEAAVAAPPPYQL